MNIKPLFRFMMFVMLGMSLYSAQPYNDYESFLKDFKSIDYDIKQAKKIQSFILPLNYAEIFMEDGVYYPLTALNGRTYGGLFVGEGNFEFNIPNKAEKCQLKRFYQREAINSPIEWVLVFSASDLHNHIMQSGEDFKTSKEPTDTPLEVLKYANLTINKNIVNGNISKAILDAENNNYSYHVIKCKDIDDPLIYEISNRYIEPIILHRAMPTTHGFNSELISQFYPKNNDGKIEVAQNDYDYLHPLKYTTSIVFDANLKVKFNMSVDLKALRETGNWIITNLFPRCAVDEIKINGEKVYYYKDNLYSMIYIRVPKSFSTGTTFKLDMQYGGTMFMKNSEENFTLFESSWYPKFGSYLSSKFDITARYGRKNVFKTIGKEVESKEVDGDIISHWITDSLENRATFFISPYINTKSTLKDGTELDIVHRYEGDKSRIIEQIGFNLELGKFLFGVSPNKNITAIINTNPLLNIYKDFISMHGFFLNSNYSFDLGYELTKQFWINQFNINSYRDVWMIDGLARYIPMLFIQKIVKDEDKYNRMLELSVKHHLSDIRGIGKSAQAPAPISAGYRYNSNYLLNNTNVELGTNFSNDASSAFDIYISKIVTSPEGMSKAAWFMHMLRNMVIDLNTMNEDLFVSILRDFFKTNKGKVVTTQDFLDCVERNTKFDFTWFFDQWLNTNDIPKYSYAYKTEKIDGKYVTKFKVKQENVPADFKMLVPIALVDDNKKVTATRAYITGDKVIEFALAPTDLEPDEVVFNYLNSVLCELDEIGWDSF